MKKKKIQATFDSVKGYINEFFVYDTGSTDNTIEVIKTYCMENSIKLHLLEGPFVNFFVSRNQEIKFVEKTLAGQEKWLLFMDVSDEMRNMNLLADFIKTYTDKYTGFYLEQNWKFGENVYSYYNIRLAKSGHGWKWVANEVHEVLGNEGPDELYQNKLRNIILFQDRDRDEGKSLKRWESDREILLAKYEKDNHDSRTLYYLANTYSSLNQKEEAIKFYKLRLKEEGFLDEVFNSYMFIGNILISMEKPFQKAMKWYLRAFQYYQRAEPLINIAEHYLYQNMKGEKVPEYHTAYMFANMACQLNYPENAMLSMAPANYHYKRWHILCRAAWYVGRYREGRDACVIAIKAENRDVDKINLKYYIQKELKLIVDSTNPAYPSKFAISYLGDELRNDKHKDIIDKDVKNIYRIVDEVVESDSTLTKIRSTPDYAQYRRELAKLFR